MSGIKIIAAGIAGTFVMTLFSKILSRTEKENFDEPEILSKLYCRLDNRYLPSDRDRMVGYSLHYGVGVLFNLVYVKLLNTHKRDTSLAEELFIGVASGIIGVSIWQVTLILHPDPPRLSWKDFYKQLIVAHIFLSVTACELNKKLA